MTVNDSRMTQTGGTGVPPVTAETGGTPVPPGATTEPATSFKWVIVAGLTVWALGAAMIVWSRFLSN